VALIDAGCLAQIETGVTASNLSCILVSEIPPQSPLLTAKLFRFSMLNDDDINLTHFSSARLHQRRRHRAVSWCFFSSFFYTPLRDADC